MTGKPCFAHICKIIQKIWIWCQKNRKNLHIFVINPFTSAQFWDSFIRNCDLGLQNWHKKWLLLLENCNMTPTKSPPPHQCTFRGIFSQIKVTTGPLWLTKLRDLWNTYCIFKISLSNIDIFTYIWKLKTKFHFSPHILQWFFRIM